MFILRSSGCIKTTVTRIVDSCEIHLFLNSLLHLKSEKNRDPVLPTLTLIDQPILPCRPHSISQGSDPWRRVTGQRIGIRTFTLNPEGCQLQEVLGTIYKPEIRRLRFRPRQAAIRLEPRASFVLPCFLKLG